MELEKIKGVSDKRIKELQKLSIYNCESLIRHFPKNYLDLSTVQNLQSCNNYEMALIKAKPVSFPQNRISHSKRISYVKVICESDNQFFTIIWFNSPYVLQKLKAEHEYLFYGRIKNEYGQITLMNPTFEPLDKNYRLKGIVPVYKSGNIAQGIMSSIVKNALNICPPKTTIPFFLERKYGLRDLRQAYYGIHFPRRQEDIKNCSERIALEEYFLLTCSFKLIKGGKERVRQNEYSTCADDIKEFSKRFGFEFTNGQKQAINEIFSDLKNPHVMNRLLQGDVGSGKTAVAYCAMFVALKSGYQVAYMCPTEILAEQNYKLCLKFFPEYETVFLSSSLKKSEKTTVKKDIANGNAKIVVGTHAIIQSDVVFKNLSLCVCDEQHRFGVAHRNALNDKGIGCDTLVMSATPIPRTYSLVLYGDLDVSEIKEKPKRRGELKTGIVPYKKYDGMLDFIRKEIENGKQAYFVCPKIQDDEEGEIMSVTALYEQLKERLPQINFGLLHGKLKDEDKKTVMNDFKGNKISAIVSTTVIEVGIDVPNATVMVIYNAERFGLSQLHQLRGRVGRGNDTSYCFLLSDSEDEKTCARLSVLKNNADGFKIAEYDFKMRGGGDFLGTRQSGELFKEVGNLYYGVETIMQAKKLSDEAFENCSQSEMETIKREAVLKYDVLKDVTLN